jgi:hypothetical protein
VCNTTNHTTGWKVVRVVRWEDKWFRQFSTLYLRCRTEHCIETSRETLVGYWYDDDFPGMKYKDGIGT